ncbi:hypothetical protein [Leptolyngbya boryana]|uniref:hypothetical protein n=1 Tax=Leptolyngbya boryana TaxID=1184 RepID=UPI00036672E1|nr:hypothetical protein [Leptolyngbya boryana]ULP30197.1 hypothetical protein MCP04_00130 [Leptolyngbya boryana IU 594]
MSYCLCCSEKLLRHVRSTGVYWFCSNCRQEMPNVVCLSPKSAINSRVTIGGNRAEI